jgi:hypothetical protein
MQLCNMFDRPNMCVQVYCKDDLSNLPCWTPPFIDDKASVLKGALASLPEHMWCMKGHSKTAGCAVFQIMRGGAAQLIVESNTFGSKEMVDETYFSAKACETDPSKCIMWKQSPPSLLDALIKMFMDIGTVPVSNQVIIPSSLTLFVTYLTCLCSYIFILDLVHASSSFPIEFLPSPRMLCVPIPCPTSLHCPLKPCTCAGR